MTSQIRDDSRASPTSPEARTTANFDDIDLGSSVYGTVPDGYAKLDWSNFYLMDPYEFFGGFENGYSRCMTSSPHDGFNGNARPCSVYSDGGNFTLESVNLGCGYELRLEANIIGLRDGVEIYRERVKITDNAATHLDLGFKDVNEVRFQPLGEYPTSYTDRIVNGSMVFDDFVFSHFTEAEHSRVSGDAFGIGSEAVTTSLGDLSLGHDGGIDRTYHLLTLA